MQRKEFLRAVELEKELDVLNKELSLWMKADDFVPDNDYDDKPIALVSLNEKNFLFPSRKFVDFGKIKYAAMEKIQAAIQENDNEFANL